MADPEHIYHWYRLDDRITTSGQPTEQQLIEIALMGARHVINLAPHDHATALLDEAASVRGTGMSYTNIPVVFQNPTSDDFSRFCSVMAGVESVPVHVHCAANYRVAAFLYRYRCKVLGVDDARARADLDKVWRPEGVWVDFIKG